jgi:5'-3' exonuclease
VYHSPSASEVTGIDGFNFLHSMYYSTIPPRAVELENPLGFASIISTVSGHAKIFVNRKQHLKKKTAGVVIVT